MNHNHCVWLVRQLIECRIFAVIRKQFFKVKSLTDLFEKRKKRWRSVLERDNKFRHITNKILLRVNYLEILALQFYIYIYIYVCVCVCVIDIWKAVNPRLPLLKEISVVNKVKILCFQKAKQISRKHLPAGQTKFWKEKLDTFFDISSCSCNLPIFSWDNINVKCTKENCQTKHIICTCPLTKKPTKKYEDIPPIASTLYVQGDSSHSYSSSPSDETEDYKQLD